MKISRRSFLATSAVSVTALSASRVLGANERLRIGSIGLGGRGMSSANWFNELPGVEIGYLCDVDAKTLERAKMNYPEAKTTLDMNQVFEDTNIDAVVISTCNHWHVLAAIRAIQAGKDVYVEKPVSHNIWEGRKLVEASRKYNRIVQGGTQQRSNPFQSELADFLASGSLGKMDYVRCNHYGLRNSIGKRDTPLPPPESVDYNLWLGPAEDLPMYREQFHYDWHWIWNTGNGELGNWGPHILDDLRNVVFRDKVTLPRHVLAAGGRFGWNDAGESPNTHFLYIDTGDVPVIVDIHNLPRQKGLKAGDIYKPRRTSATLVVEFEGGYYAGGRGGGAHAANFIDAVRSRKRSDLNAEIEEIHYSSAWCHLGNISWRLGRDYHREEADAQIKGFKPWNDVIEQFHRHLDANEIDLKTADVKLGSMLEVDAASETLVGPTATPAAKALLTREYRRGFEVPEKV